MGVDHDSLRDHQNAPSVGDPQAVAASLAVLYVGSDAEVWLALGRIDDAALVRARAQADGACDMGAAGSQPAVMPDLVIIDEAPGDAEAALVLKWAKSLSSAPLVVMLTSADGRDTAARYLDLGADDSVVKNELLPRRLQTIVGRVQQQVSRDRQRMAVKAREDRLRAIVENAPAGVSVVALDGPALAMNAEAARLYNPALSTGPRPTPGIDGEATPSDSTSSATATLAVLEFFADRAGSAQSLRPSGARAVRRRRSSTPGRRAPDCVLDRGTAERQASGHDRA